MRKAGGGGIVAGRGEHGALWLVDAGALAARRTAFGCMGGIVKIHHQGHQGAGDLEAADRGARLVVDAGLKVHKALGPGLLESTYEHCLAHEVHARGLSVERQVSLPITYDGVRLDAAYRLDVLVEQCIIVEIKAVDALTRLHVAQLLTYVKLSGHRIGLLMNFNVDLFKHGVKRLIL